MLKEKNTQVTTFETGLDKGIYIHNTETLYLYDTDTRTMDLIIVNVDLEQATDIMKFVDVEGDESLERKYGFDDWDYIFSGVSDRESFAQMLVELSVIDSMNQVRWDVEDAEALGDLMDEGFHI